MTESTTLEASLHWAQTLRAWSAQTNGEYPKRSDERMIVTLANEVERLRKATNTETETHA